MPTLVFQLQGVLSSWGVAAVGEYRGSDHYPSESALIGLISAALGIRRDQDDQQRAIAESYGYAVGVLSAGELLRDYHTAQVPGQAALKKRPHRTRSDELCVGKKQLNTVLSTRDYRQNGAYLIAVQSSEAAPYSLDELAAALAKPRFTLYLGRKSCPPSAPLMPRVLEEDNAQTAFSRYLTDFAAISMENRDRYGNLPVAPLGEIDRLVWGKGIASGVEQADLTTTRKDRLISRRGWQFGDRT
ncbi:MAG: type I-E CRISPR-associated protein Cas5/CasD, partial [Panacagrimonas sp.]